VTHKFKKLSVIDIAEICGVARSTVSYWIAKKTLPAKLLGKKHMVSVEDLAAFLEFNGRPVPQILLESIGGMSSHPLKPIRKCWDFWADYDHGQNCHNCRVFRYQLMECFTAKGNPKPQCPINCDECPFFYKFYVPRVSFVHQIDRPAAIYKDLCLWAGNGAWAELCGIEAKDLIGIGIEEFIHSDSLTLIISWTKRLSHGDEAVPFGYRAFFNGKNGARIETFLSISPLKKPSGTVLAMAEKLN
jgi:helix-turn-helix protein